MEEKDNLASVSHVPQPLIRLGLTVVFGLLGVRFLSFHDSIVPNLQCPFFLVWLIVVFVGVILLHRVEHIRTPVRLYAFMVLLLVLTLVNIPLPNGYRMIDLLASLAKSIVVPLLLLVAGVLFFGLPFERDSRWRWVARMVRGLFLAIASPLLLFSLRPRSIRPFSVKTASARVAFILFLYALTFPLISFGRNNYPSGVLHFVDEVSPIMWAFSFWAWFGCAVLFLLTPWIEMPSFSGTNNKMRMHRRVFWGFVCFMLIAIVLLAILDRQGFERVVGSALFLFFFGLPWFALFFMTCSIFAHLRLPKLANLESGIGMGPLGTGFLLLLLVVPFTVYFYGYVLGVVTGGLFLEPPYVDLTYMSKWALDTSGIPTLFWRFTLFFVIVSTCVAVTRWLSDLTSRLNRRIIAISVIVLFLCLFSYLTCTFYLLLEYIAAFGLTTMRIYGLVYGLSCYIALFGFLWVAAQTEKEKPNTFVAAITVLGICVYSFFGGSETLAEGFKNAWYFLTKGIFCSLALYLLMRILARPSKKHRAITQQP